MYWLSFKCNPLGHCQGSASLTVTNKCCILTMSTRRPLGESKRIRSLSPAEHLFVLLTFQVIYQCQGQNENWTWNNLYNLLIVTIKLKDKSRINTSIIPWIGQGFFFKFISLHDWRKFSDLHLQITGKCICVPPYPCSCHGFLISLLRRTYHINK